MIPSVNYKRSNPYLLFQSPIFNKEELIRQMKPVLSSVAMLVFVDYDPRVAEPTLHCPPGCLSSVYVRGSIRP